ncbi:DUF7837 family putative zinc-binding protein [Halarchaeum nitratireducens]|uniref:DUF7837 domain-containing protein n=1 Tax=Halarchaeum nitratireducens TaxID=489913 RepID=A0A830GD29_9EURY|nr:MULTISPECIES: hypothetical protein [Halarchaeum]MBP2251736.1 putative C2H2 Zn-finger protein [Halarchaeum solikamskense]GGN22657.1 hypothetical protein GCM10009021_25260 [Halarchaeum nitratireducens]
MTDADGADGTDGALGRCPECGADVPATAVLIEYEDDDGEAAYAACPSCDTVVKPRS